LCKEAQSDAAERHGDWKLKTGCSPEEIAIHAFHPSSLMICRAQHARLDAPLHHDLRSFQTDMALKYLVTSTLLKNQWAKHYIDRSPAQTQGISPKNVGLRSSLSCGTCLPSHSTRSAPHISGRSYARLLQILRPAFRFT